MAGRVDTDTNTGVRTRTYTYDNLGRLTQTVEGATTRRYSFDANTNRCALAATCDATWTYNPADRLTASPQATSYNYNTHGQLIAEVRLDGKTETIGYDGNDHATTIDNATTTTTETLAPTGRVLERKVTNDTSHVVTEDTIYGYADTGDSPAYSRAAAGGPVTTYLGACIDVAGTATWEIQNAHGDIVGTTDTLATYTANPVTDEYGVGTAPANRLGYLGGHERFTTDPALGLIRMGHRLYDPALGRFLQTDPVPGGSANNYDYVSGDPVDGFDLAGTICWRCAVRHFQNAVGRAMDNPWVQGALVVGACSTGFACGPAIAVTVGWSAGRRLRREGFGTAFVAGTALDLGLALLPVRPLRGLARPAESAFGRPLTYGAEHVDWRRATLMARVSWNSFVGALGVARSHLPF